MLCRDAGSPFWRDERYDAPAAGGPPGIAYATGTVTALNPLDYAPATWESTTPLAPVGIEAEAPVWAWVPRNQSDSISFYVAAGNAVGSLDVQFEVLHPNGTIDNITMIGVGYSGDGVKQLPVSDVWVKISSIKVLAGPTTLILYNSPGRFLMPVFAPLESTVSTAPYDSCRANAVSLLLTNVSRVQIKQGTILAGRLQRADIKPWAWRESDISNVHPADRYFGSAEVGAYTYVAPGQNTSNFRQAGATMGLITKFQPNATTLKTTGTHFAPSFHVFDDEYFHALVVSEEVNADETIMAITCDVHVEFRSSSSLFQLGISAMPLEAYHATLLALNQTGYFFENHTHWRDLASLLVRGINAALPVVAPQFAGPVRAIGSAAVAGYKAGKALISTMRRKPRTMTQKQMVVPRPAPRQKRGKRARRARSTRRR